MESHQSPILHEESVSSRFLKTNHAFGYRSGSEIEGRHQRESDLTVYIDFYCMVFEEE